MKVYTCARCGRRLKRDRWIYSKWTGNRYCIRECRPVRRKKAGAP